MKKLPALFVIVQLVIFHSAVFSQQGQWTWMSGDWAIQQPGVYGTPMVPDTNNKPGGRYEAGNFTDANNNFWLFGGSGVPCSTCLGYGMLNDLWKYNPSTNEWTFMKGDSMILQPGHYGTKGVPSPLNKPGGRAAFPSWNETGGYLWLFGGYAGRNDLWRYNIAANEWTWMTGDSTLYSAGVYGIKGVASPLNTPGGRDEVTCAWKGNENTLWLLGGRGYDVNGSYGMLNDLWKYDIGSNEWTWMSGDSLINQTAVYGVKGVMSPTNKPGGRYTYCRWKDLSGNLWLFGGSGYPVGYYLNDLWKYNMQAGEWTWMSGDSVSALNGGNFGSQCIADSSNMPSHRTENKACWTDACGNFWMYGGHQPPHCDLWKYDVSTNEWKWINGSTPCTTVWGTKGVASPLNSPGNRIGAPSWLSADGSFWMFGDVNLKNDLWKYVPDINCGGCTLVTSVSNIQAPVTGMQIFPNPATSELIVSSSEFGEKIEIEIYNMLGEVVLNYQLSTINYQLSIDVNQLLPGVYFVTAIDDKGNKTIRRFVKM